MAGKPEAAAGGSRSRAKHRCSDAATLASTDRAAHTFSAAAELARCTGKLQAQFGGPLIGSINS